MNPKRMMAELYGRAEGYCQGKGGSMHIADISKGMLGANGIIGSGQPLAVGAGMKASVHDSDEVVISFLGDGGVAQGQVHESINLAAVWDLPVIFFIENNQYAEASSVTSQYSITDLSDIAGSYNLPGETIDGMDVEEVSRTTSRAVERARNGDGPSVLEANTYRYHGHFEGDPETYRQQSEVEEWQNRDPIIRFTEQLLDEGNLTKSELEEMRKEIEKEIDAAVKFGRQSTKPPVEKAYHGMYDEAPADIEYHRDRPKKVLDDG
jgi:pyruvate dehydrogenase E1 component alpha subunit